MLNSVSPLHRPFYALPVEAGEFAFVPASFWIPKHSKAFQIDDGITSVDSHSLLPREEGKLSQMKRNIPKFRVRCSSAILAFAGWKLLNFTQYYNINPTHFDCFQHKTKSGLLGRVGTQKAQIMFQNAWTCIRLINERCSPFGLHQNTFARVETMAR